jgi:glucokinase
MTTESASRTRTGEARFIGIDVGGTKVVTAVLEDGAFTISDPVPTRTDTADGLIEQLLGQIEAHRGGHALAVAVGVPSIVDVATGRIRHTVNLPLADIPLRSVLSDRCGLPVYVENDASCAALAEAQVAGQIVSENLVMFTIGTGVGGGLVLGGKLYRGVTSAVELGHTIVGLDLTEGAPTDPGTFPQPGSLEVLAAGRALDRLTVESARAHPKSFLGRRLARGEELTGHDAVEGAREGDVHCQHVVRILGERLGIGIANAINTFDPDEVVIGGGVSLAGDLLLVPAERTARRHTVPGAGLSTKIRVARHGPQAGVLGAATVAAQEWAHDRATAAPRRNVNDPALSAGGNA